MKYLIGTGNYSMYDDSVGLRLVEHIIDHKLNTGFEVLDLSANLLNLLSYLNQETQKILIIDTIKTDHSKLKRPGDFIIFGIDQVQTQKTLSGISTHEGDIIKTIDLARQTGYHIPLIKFMGIKPETVVSGFGLSQTLQKNMNYYAKIAIKELLQTHWF